MHAPLNWLISLVDIKNVNLKYLITKLVLCEFEVKKIIEVNTKELKYLM